MKSFKSVSTGVLLLLFIGWPVLISGTRQQGRNIVEAAITTHTAPPVSIPLSPEELSELEANSLYDSMRLKRLGLTKKAFFYMEIGRASCRERV